MELVLETKYELRIGPNEFEKLSKILDSCSASTKAGTDAVWKSYLIELLGEKDGATAANNRIRIATIASQKTPELYQLYPFVIAYGEEAA